MNLELTNGDTSIISIKDLTELSEKQQDDLKYLLYYFAMQQTSLHEPHIDSNGNKIGNITFNPEETYKQLTSSEEHCFLNPDQISRNNNTLHLLMYNERVMGFVATQILQDNTPKIGRIFELCVAPRDDSIQMQEAEKKAFNDKESSISAELAQLNTDFFTEQKSGVGKYLMNFIHGFLQERGVDTITLHVLQNNKKAKSFYEKLGYVLSETYTDNTGLNVNAVLDIQKKRTTEFVQQESLGSVQDYKRNRGLTLQQIGKGTARDVSSNPQLAMDAIEALETEVKAQERINEGQTQGNK